MWQRSDDWVGSEIEDKFVMVNIESGKYVALNATANAIWQALEQQCDEDGIVAELLGQFVVEEGECRASVLRSLGEMQKLAMISEL